MWKQETERFLAIWEFHPYAINKIRLKAKMLLAEMNENPESYPRQCYGPYTFEGEHKGFQVFETDDAEKLDRLTQFWSPDMKISFIPIVKTRLWSRDLDFEEHKKMEKPSLIIC